MSSVHSSDFAGFLTVLLGFDFRDGGNGGAHIVICVAWLIHMDLVRNFFVT